MAGLTKLEYRGYDSAGATVHDGAGVLQRRKVGKLRTRAGPRMGNQA